MENGRWMEDGEMDKEWISFQDISKEFKNTYTW